MVDRKGNPSSAKLFVRIAQDSTLVVAGDALERAKMSANELSHPLISNLSDAVTNISDTVSNQQNLISSHHWLRSEMKLPRFVPLYRLRAVGTITEVFTTIYL